MNYIPSIGLEVHAELKTDSKMFCACKNDPDERHPNVNVCPVCLGHPGTLPVPNKKAIASLIKIGMAVNGDVAKITKFDRKSYFYPDLPKGYQISQYDMPIVSGGEIAGIPLTRIHLEEDTGRLIHSSDKKSTLVDFNRAGVPLMELVTEPEVKNAAQARAFAEELRRILRALGASDADMEKGQMRIEANVSIRPEGTETLGTKVEVKNINSFKAVESAILYEIKRQTEALEKGEALRQETRGWDDMKRVTKSQRSKESAHDYRYIPEPDIPPIDLEKQFDMDLLRMELPELPDQKRARFAEEYGLAKKQIELLINDFALADFFENAVSEIKAADKRKTVSLLFNYLSTDLVGLLTEQNISMSGLQLTPAQFADLVSLAADGKISSRVTKDVLKKMIETGLEAHHIVGTENLHQTSDETEIETAARRALGENPDIAEKYRSGKTTVIQFLVGKTMAILSGRGNPAVVKAVLERLLSK
ncbi:MAG: Asp-tRNA(Asn)/Glu-tRNA(Gln) amidotransferase subunit GatB [Candidatus Liptonbacteria bacterium]|nr:Asp-tRNA(Asn)/Glu-tRNA(Gln) amidotransferase subunit GatB [Candidatus Liptonbacteria bacterium]